MPSKHNGVASFKNAAMAIKTKFPQLGKKRHDDCPELAAPTPLPIFFNGENITPAQKEQAQKSIIQIIKQAKREQVDLLNFFFPKYTQAHKAFSTSWGKLYFELRSLPSYQLQTVVRLRGP